MSVDVPVNRGMSAGVWNRRVWAVNRGVGVGVWRRWVWVSVEV